MALHADGAANAAASKESADTSALGGAKTKAALDTLLSQLPKCISRELCDETSVNFCYMNSKAARKRLVSVCVVSADMLIILQHKRYTCLHNCSIAAALVPCPVALTGLLWLHNAGPVTVRESAWECAAAAILYSCSCNTQRCLS